MPLALSAATTPSATAQLASPIRVQLSRPLPSNSATHPASACPDALGACRSAAEPASKSAMAMADERFMVLSSLMTIVEALPRRGPGRARSGNEYTKPADDPEADWHRIDRTNAPDHAF